LRRSCELLRYNLTRFAVRLTWCRYRHNVDKEIGTLSLPTLCPLAFNIKHHRRLTPELLADVLLFCRFAFSTSFCGLIM